MYSPELLDYFQNPRNGGDLPDADAMAEIENPVCGDVVRISLKIDSGRIREIRFKARGCVPTMACASAMTELAAGKTVVEALALNRTHFTAVLGELPPASAHAMQVVLDALAAALRQVRPRP
jgi:nitrogen fixation protein NifU and related proteins